MQPGTFSQAPTHTIILAIQVNCVQTKYDAYQHGNQIFSEEQFLFEEQRLGSKGHIIIS